MSSKAEQGVLKRRIIPSSTLPIISGVISYSGLSITRAFPHKSSSVYVSMVRPPSMKWAGASMWVPVWVPRENSVTVHISPFSVLHIFFEQNSGSPGYIYTFFQVSCYINKHNMAPFSIKYIIGSKNGL